MATSSSTAAAETGYPETFARDVARDLTRDPKQLQSKYLYDPLGSKLFEAICELPWYGITRGERALLETHGEAIVSVLGDPATLIELGAGSGDKLSVLLRACERAGRETRVHLIDISPTALALSIGTLSRHPDIPVVGHETTYEAGLHEALVRQDSGACAMILFLGSNIGNLSAPEADRFLRLLRTGVRHGDLLLLGADLVRPEADLVRAYDDPLGVSAAFNKNLLVRINRELDGDFDLGQFRHRATWHAADGRIESHLVSQVEQTVCITGAGCCVRFEKGESIWTESSYKYEPVTISDMGERAGFGVRHQWVEPRSRFALTLFEAV